MENIPQVFNGYFDLGLLGIWYVLLTCVAIHAAVLTYHWFAYGTSRTINLLSLGIYIAGAAFLLLIMHVTLSTL